MKTVTISSPIRNREWIISHYLSHLYQIDYPKHLISLHFVINNSTDNSEKIINNFKTSYLHEYNKITIDNFTKNKNMPEDKRTNEVRQNHIYSHLSDLRNFIFTKVETDFLLSCDSDILVPPDIITKLLSHKQQIVSSLIYNGFFHDSKNVWKYPNILKIMSDGKIEHIANSYVKKAPTSDEGKLLSVDCTGAVCLMSNKVAKNTEYGFHVQGEDIFWSLDCLNKGYKLFCDTGCFSHHIMSEELLQQYIESKNYIKKYYQGEY